MSRVVDNLIAFRILQMMIVPFNETDAYKLGIIDEKGNNLIKFSSLSTTDQKEAYTYLHRLVFKLKKIINKIGGESKLKTLAAALFLVKENYESSNRSLSFIEDQLTSIINKSETTSLVEEEIFVSEFLDIINEEGGAGAPTNSTSGAVGLDQPFVRKKRKMQSFIVNDDLYNRFKNGKSKYRKWSEYLNLENEGEKSIYDWARKNPKGILVLKNGKELKAIRYNRNGGGSWPKINRKPKNIINENEMV